MDRPIYTLKLEKNRSSYLYAVKISVLCASKPPINYAHPKHWIFISAYTKWVVFCIMYCMMQSAMMAYINVQCILDCLPVFVSTEPVYSDDHFVNSCSNPYKLYQWLYECVGTVYTGKAARCLLISLASKWLPRYGYFTEWSEMQHWIRKSTINNQHCFDENSLARKERRPMTNTTIIVIPLQVIALMVQFERHSFCNLQCDFYLSWHCDSVTQKFKTTPARQLNILRTRFKFNIHIFDLWILTKQNFKQLLSSDEELLHNEAYSTSRITLLIFWVYESTHSCQSEFVCIVLSARPLGFA